MLDSEVLYELGYELQKKVIAHETFSAYNITQILREDGIRCLHNDVKAEVHRAFDSGLISGYNRRLCDAPGGGQYWEYYYDRPDTAISTLRTPSTARDYSAIQNRVQDLYQLGLKTQDEVDKALGVVHTSGYVQVADNAADLDTNPYCTCTMVSTAPEPDYLEARADKRSTVCVPADAIRQLGLKPGWVALIIPCKQEKLVRVENPTTRALDGLGWSENARQYIVDSHYNVRITKGVFVEADCSGPKYRVTVNADEVVLETL